MTLAEKKRATKGEVANWHVLHATRDGGCLLHTACRDPHGYGRVSHQGRKYLLHRLVAEVWLQRELAHGEHVLHKCHEPRCINPHHLYVGTAADNAADRVMVGHQVSLKGEANPAAKLTDEGVRQIRKLHAAGFRRGVLSVIFGVSGTQIRKVVVRKAWRHIR